MSDENKATPVTPTTAMEDAIFGNNAKSQVSKGGPSIEVMTEVDKDGRIHLIIPSEVNFSTLRKSEKAVYFVCKADPLKLNIVERDTEGKVTRQAQRSTKNIALNLFLDV